MLTTRILHKLTPAHLRLPNDAKGKVLYLGQQRRAVLIELKGVANTDGTEVKLAVKTIMAALGASRPTVFRRLDDLKTIGILVDEGRLGYNKPMRRRLNLVRAQELLGMVTVKTGRPEALPDCVSDELWQQFVTSPWLAPEDVESIATCLRHQFHVPARTWKCPADAETFIVESLRFAIAVKTLPMDLCWYGQPECRVEGCPGCALEYFDQDPNEDDASFAARWQCEAFPGDRVIPRENHPPGGFIVTADRTLRPLGQRTSGIKTSLKFPKGE